MPWGGFYLTTHPLYPPPLRREGEGMKKRGFAPLKHPGFLSPVWLRRDG